MYICIKYEDITRFVKTFRKILIFIIVTCIWSLVQDIDSEVSNIPNSGYITSNDYDYSALSASEPEFSIPRPTNLGNIPRSQTSLKRNNNPNISSTHIIKSGKVIDFSKQNGIPFCIKLFPSGLYKSSHWLISLRKLII